jgi:hypothetical protein
METGMPLRVPILADLKEFGIHVANLERRCCRCSQPVQSEGIFADELCSGCGVIRVPQAGTVKRLSRRKAIFYRPRSVFVTSGIQPGQRRTRHPMLSCVVKIDGELCRGFPQGDYVSLHSMSGRPLRHFGLQLDQAHLLSIFVAQR